VSRRALARGIGTRASGRDRAARATGTHAAVPRCPTGATGDRTGLRMAERAVLRDARVRPRDPDRYRARAPPDRV